MDLERHCVADLLPDRSAEGLALWLEKHPAVEIIARDRGGLYADGANQGTPFAKQVADRFHLVLNLSSAIERVLEERSRELALPPEATSLTTQAPLGTAVLPAQASANHPFAAEWIASKELCSS